MNIHRFSMGGLNIVLDVNSGAVHVLDDVAYDLLAVFDGGNRQAATEALAGRYSVAEINDALDELQAAIEGGSLFSAAPEIPALLAHKPLVKSLCLHIAHDCNLRCGYCFADTGDFGMRRDLMPPEVAEQAIEFIIQHSGPRKFSEIDFFGGEPLLNFETVKHAVSYARKREKETGKVFRLTLTTNAVLLNEEILEFLNANEISLVLSLDGRAEVHDAVRPFSGGKGSYEYALRGIRQAVESRQGQNYYVRGTFTAKNLDFAADVMAMYDEGFRQLSVEPVVLKDGELALGEEHLPQIAAEYERLAEEYLAKKQQGEGFEFFHFNMNIHHGPCVAKRLSGCGAGHEYMAVTPEGDLYPCHQFVGREQYRLGSVQEGVTNQELPVVFRQNHVLNKEACRTCWARYHCSGGCHANADLIHGDIAKPYEIGCELQKKRLECALMIQARLALAGQE